MKRNVITLFLMALLFSGMCIVENSTVKARPGDPRLTCDSSVYALAGEFRTVFANLLWIKAENYHHEYVARGGDWAKNKELLGLITLITTIDPRFVEAYSTGAIIYSSGQKNPQKAVKYLQQGIDNNPNASELHEIMAVLYARHLHKPGRAVPYAKLAVKYAEDDWNRKRLTRLLHTIEHMTEN